MTKRKILTVVLLSAGCGSAATKSTPSTSATPTAAPRTAEVPVTQVAGLRQVAGVQHVAAPSIMAMPPSTPPPILGDDAQPRERLELRAALYRGGPDAARLTMERFRALCDADGYPLVGNVANKGMRYEVADYCKDVRNGTTPGPDA